MKKYIRLDEYRLNKNFNEHIMLHQRKLYIIYILLSKAKIWVDKK